MTTQNVISTFEPRNITFSLDIDDKRYTQLEYESL